MNNRILIKFIACITIGTSIILIILGILIGIFINLKGVEFNQIIYWLPIVLSLFGISGVMNIVRTLLDEKRKIIAVNLLRIKLIAGMTAFLIHAISGYKLGEYYSFILIIPLIGLVYFAYLGREYLSKT